MTDIAGRTTLVTGAARGMGRLLCLASARLGGRVVGLDLDKDKLDDTVEEIGRDTGAEVHGYVCDVAERERVYQVADQILHEVGAVDILVNNAGIVSGDNFLDIPDDKIQATFAVNALAPFWLTKAFLPGMIERNSGHIVTVASAAALAGVAKQTDYSASKAAAVNFDESLRVELRETAPGVVTTVVCPLYVNTGMFEGATTRFPWLTPMLEQEEVVSEIIDAIRRNRRRVILPPAVRLVWLLRELPVPIFDAILDVLGINQSMKDFVGRE